MSTENGLVDGGGEFMLFGVRVKVDPMRKSVSLNDLSLYELPNNHDSTNVPVPIAIAGDVDTGYASADDVVHRKGVIRERKRGVPWTEDEHKLFLLGLQKVGKGDWRGISRNFVKTRTPTQVASHAQKYFLRRSNITRRRRRSSLFDITTDSVTAVPMEENVHQEHKAEPLILPAQLSLVETSLTDGPQLFPMTMSPISVSAPMDSSMEKFNFGNLGYINRLVLQAPAQTNMGAFNLNQKLAEETSPLSLNLSLSLDRVQDQFSGHLAFETMSSFNNGDNMISVA